MKKIIIISALALAFCSCSHQRRQHIGKFETIRDSLYYAALVICEDMSAYDEGDGTFCRNVPKWAQDEIETTRIPSLNTLLLAIDAMDGDCLADAFDTDWERGVSLHDYDILRKKYDNMIKNYKLIRVKK